MKITIQKWLHVVQYIVRGEKYRCQLLGCKFKKRRHNWRRWLSLKMNSCWCHTAQNQFDDVRNINVWPTADDCRFDCRYLSPRIQETLIDVHFHNFEICWLSAMSQAIPNAIRDDAVLFDCE